tara:strand:+ start:923 stop:1366 length:444 start_codon:yes stop_codon:yes gene_type:complete
MTTEEERKALDEKIGFYPTDSLEKDISNLKNKLAARIDERDTAKKTVETAIIRAEDAEAAYAAVKNEGVRFDTFLVKTLEGNNEFFVWFVKQCQETGALCTLNDWMEKQIEDAMPDHMVTTDDVRDLIDERLDNLSIEVEVTEVSTR